MAGLNVAVRNVKMAHEIQQRHCKICGQLKARINLGQFPNKSSKRWVDETGKQWCGLLCPDCQRNRAKANMRILRNSPNGSSEV